MGLNDSIPTDVTQVSDSETVRYSYKRQIIDDSFLPGGPLPHCGLEEDATSDDAREAWHNANKRFAACAAMYEYLDNQGILKKEAFCYDVIPEQTVGDKHYHKQVNFAVDSQNLMKYREQMLASGVQDANIATAHILGENENVVEPSHISGATCLTWTMQSYRSNCGCVGRSWETPHEQHYYLDTQTGIGKTYDSFHDAHHDFKTGAITEDQYFDKVKEGISDIYKRDRTVYLSKVPGSFVRETKNPDYMTVSLPCDKSKSDDGRLRITVKSDAVMEDDYGKKIICLGDIDTPLRSSVKKGNNWEHPKDMPIDVARNWRQDRKEYADNFRKTYGAAVELQGVPASSVKSIGKTDYSGLAQSKVDLDNIGSIYVSTKDVKKTTVDGQKVANIQFYSGLDNVRVYSKDDAGNKVVKTMNARALTQLWDEQASQRQSDKDKASIAKASSEKEDKTSDKQDENSGLG